MRASPYLAIGVGTLVCYYTSLSCDLVFDDVAAIKENHDIRPRTPIAQLFFHDYWGTPVHKEESHKSYRPLSVLSFRMNYAVHGLHPLGYHLVNLVLHCAASMLFYRLCLHFLSRRTSLLAAVLFTVHPIHTEAVTGVVGRAELLCGIHFLCALLYFLQNSPHTTGVQVCLVPSALALSGMLCKEQCVTVLPVCAVYMVACKGPNLMHILRHRRRKLVPPWFWTLMTRLCLLTVSTLVLGAFRIWIMGPKLPVFSRFDNPARVASTPVRQLSYNYLLAVNAWLALYPSELCCDWTMGSVPLVTGFRDPRNFGTGLLYTALLLIAFSTRGSEKRHRRAVIMGLSLLCVTFVPASNLLFPVGFVIAERVLYLPSMGLALLVAIGYDLLADRRKKLMQIAVTVLVASHSLRTALRNRDWETDQTLFSSALAVNTRNAKLFNNYGRALEAQSRHDEALHYYRIAMTLQPDDIRSYLYTGKALSYLGRHGEAEAMFLKAKTLLPHLRDPLPHDLRLTSSHLQVFLNLAATIARNNSRLAEADQIVQEVISLRGDFTDAYVSRGDLLMKMNKTKDAEDMYRKAIFYEGGSPDLFNNYGLALMDRGRSEEALHFFTKALDIDPEHEKTLLNLALLVQESNSISAREIAINRLREVVNQGDRNETLYFRLGMTALEQKETHTAEKWFKKAIQIQPAFRSALYNLGFLLSEQNRSSEALPILLQLLRHHPDHTKGLLLLGDVYVNHLRNLDAAEQCYRKILDLEPENAQALHNLCVVFVERSDLRKAERCFLRATNQHPDVDYIRRHLEYTRTLMNVSVQ